MFYKVIISAAHTVQNFCALENFLFNTQEIKKFSIVLIYVSFTLGVYTVFCLKTPHKPLQTWHSDVRTTLSKA